MPTFATPTGAGDKPLPRLGRKTAKRQNQHCKRVPCAMQFGRCEAERATLRFDPDRISEIGESMHVAARVDVLGADLPAA